VCGRVREGLDSGGNHGKDCGSKRSPPTLTPVLALPETINAPQSATERPGTSLEAPSARNFAPPPLQVSPKPAINHQHKVCEACASRATTESLTWAPRMLNMFDMYTVARGSQHNLSANDEGEKACAAGDQVTARGGRRFCCRRFLGVREAFCCCCDNCFPKHSFYAQLLLCRVACLPPRTARAAPLPPRPPPHVRSSAAANPAAASVSMPRSTRSQTPALIIC
jgi:hypothetical protein